MGIGRGADAFDLVLRQTTSLAGESPQRSGGNSSLHPAPSHTLTHTESGLSPQVPGLFVEIPDGRVSRVHCLVSAFNSNNENRLGVSKDTTHGYNSNENKPAATLRDVSRNGTFLNGKKLRRGEESPLVDGDKVSLVISVAPLAEQAFIFHAGHPLAALLEGPPPAQWVGWKGRSLSRAATLARGESLGNRESPVVVVRPTGGSPRSPTSSTGSPKTPLYVLIYLF